MGTDVQCMQARHLEHLLRPLGKEVKEFYGSRHSMEVFGHDTGVIVATIEKANIL